MRLPDRVDAGFATTAPCIRTAALDDVPALQRLIEQSARALSRGDYSEEQIAAALGTSWGVDTDLIRDQTYFVVESGGNIVACGGWSKRRTLFGGDSQPGRHAEILSPARDAARMRAFFVHPDYARQGLGRALLKRCEDEARASGFQSAELLATLPGYRLYRALAYVGGEPIDSPLPGGLSVRCVPMRKDFGPA